MIEARPEIIADLREAVGVDAVFSEPEAVMRVIKDNSWLSPVLSENLDRRRESEGLTLGVIAVVAPTSEAAVVRVAEVAVRHRIPVTPRGSGTSNFGLVTPEAGGLILDLRGLRSDALLSGGGITAGAGTTQAVMEREARLHGRELTILTTTYASATVGGWVAGGHVGLGSSMFGSVWDNNVLAARVVTFDDKPTVRVLQGDDVFPLLHTFGVAGVMSEVTLRTDTSHEWQEAVASFPSFDSASKFVQLVSADTHFRHRVVTAQESALMPAFRMLDLPGVGGDSCGVLMIIDRSQMEEIRGIVDSGGGDFTFWQSWDPHPSAKPSIASMVYGHRMLWVKKLYPDAAFLHLYFDPTHPERDIAKLKRKFADRVLLEMKYIRSPRMLQTLGFADDSTLPAAVATVVDGIRDDTLNDVMSFCAGEGIQMQNSHTNVIEESGMFPDSEPIVEFKAQVDPYCLLNPGKLRSARLVEI